MIGKNTNLFGKWWFWVIIVILAIVGLSNLGNDDAGNVETETAKTQDSAKVESPQPERSKLAINYEIVERWDIPNGGEGKRIVISAELKTENGLFSICDKIEQDVQNQRNAFVFGHTDRRSAEIQSKMPSTSSEEEEYLGKNFILDFKKNANSGFHQCTIYPDGVDNTATEKVKTY